MLILSLEMGKLLSVVGRIFFSNLEQHIRLESNWHDDNNHDEDADDETYERYQMKNKTMLVERCIHSRGQPHAGYMYVCTIHILRIHISSGPICHKCTNPAVCSVHVQFAGDTKENLSHDCLF